MKLSKEEKKSIFNYLIDLEYYYYYYYYANCGNKKDYEDFKTLLNLMCTHKIEMPKYINKAAINK